MKKLLLLTAISTIITGCSTFTGLNAKSDFACAAPAGYSCTSMTGVYANLKNPKVQIGKKTTYLGESDNQNNKYLPRSKVGLDKYGRPPMTLGESTGIPIRTEPQIMRIWVAPWESSDRTFYDQSFVYVVVDYGDWILAHNKNNIIDQYSPIDLNSLPSGDVYNAKKVESGKKDSDITEGLDIQVPPNVMEGKLPAELPNAAALGNMNKSKATSNEKIEQKIEQNIVKSLSNR